MISYSISSRELTFDDVFQAFESSVSRDEALFVRGLGGEEYGGGASNISE